MGSGHILVYAFDVLMQMYEAEGELPRTAAELILEKNLFGLDIDKRAFQLAYFALMMKGRQYSRRILSKEIRPNVFAVPDNAGIGESELQLLHGEFLDPEKAHKDLVTLTNGFQQGHDLGSLISFEGIDFENLKAGLAKGGLSFIDEAVHEMVLVGEVLQEKFTIGVTNPPYMGSSGMNKVLVDFVKKIYPDSKSDLFGVFMERLAQMVKPDGYYAMITQHAWMFLSSFEKLRSKINQQTIINMAHLGTRAFEEIGGEVVQTTAFVMSPKGHDNYIGSYLRLVDFGNHELKETKTLEAIEDGRIDYLYHTVQDNFKKIPGQPISYWVSERLFLTFVNSNLGEIFNPRIGLVTGDGNRFLRTWQEISNTKITLGQSNQEKSEGKWFPYQKGGDYRKWYGNNEYVVNWENDGYEMRFANNSEGRVKSHNYNGEFAFKESICWTKISSSKFATRYVPTGFMYDDASPFGNVAENTKWYIVALMNSKYSREVLGLISPTLNFLPGDIKKIPLVMEERDIISRLSSKCVELSSVDWDSYEESWDFKKHPLL